MLKQIIAAAAATLAAAAPVAAAPVEGNSFSDHQDIWGTLTAAGVTPLINPSTCEPDLAGFYWHTETGNNPQLVVCQENGRPGGPEVAWTAFDLDTLRHEAQHVIQDCQDGRLDMELQTILPTEWAISQLGEAKVRRIAQSYAENGASPSTILAEYEAFAVAENVPASVIATELGQSCSFRF